MSPTSIIIIIMNCAPSETRIFVSSYNVVIERTRRSCHNNREQVKVLKQRGGSLLLKY